MRAFIEKRLRKSCGECCKVFPLQPLKRKTPFSGASARDTKRGLLWSFGDRKAIFEGIAQTEVVQEAKEGNNFAPCRSKPTRMFRMLGLQMDIMKAF